MSACIHGYGNDRKGIYEGSFYNTHGSAIDKECLLYTTEKRQNDKKKHKKGIFRGSGWIKVRVYSLSCLSFLPVYGGLVSVWVWL